MSTTLTHHLSLEVRELAKLLGCSHEANEIARAFVKKCYPEADPSRRAALKRNIVMAITGTANEELPLPAWMIEAISVSFPTRQTAVA